jgi:hypothetical protein
MAAPSSSTSFDEEHFLNILGEAYRNQAMELIKICRVFSMVFSLSQGAENISKQDAELSE